MVITPVFFVYFFSIIPISKAEGKAKARRIWVPISIDLTTVESKLKNSMLYNI